MRSAVLHKTPDRDFSIVGLMRRIFVAAFYRQHAGTFLLLYVLFLGSFLFINYLGEMPASESFFWHFVLIIFMVTEQFMVVLFLLLAGFYLIKTRLFIKELLSQAPYAFLQQSLAVMPEKKQWWIWLKVQIWLSLPLLIYGLACLGMSLFKGRPVYGAVILGFLGAGMLIITTLHYRSLAAPPAAPRSPGGLISRFRWNQTRWTLLLFSITRQWPALLMTKGATLLFTCLMLHWEREEAMPLRQWWLGFLLTGSAHAVLVFKAAQFMEERFKDFWGLPFTVLQGFVFAAGRPFLVLLLPECIILLFAGQGQMAVLGCLSELAILVFYYYFSAYLRYNLKALLKSGFLLFCVAFVLILYGLYWLVIASYLCTAFVLYRNRYHCKEP